jgi:hypothetical protein
MFNGFEDFHTMRLAHLLGSDSTRSDARYSRSDANERLKRERTIVSEQGQKRRGYKNGDLEQRIRRQTDNRSLFVRCFFATHISQHEINHALYAVDLTSSGILESSRCDCRSGTLNLLQESIFNDVTDPSSNETFSQQKMSNAIDAVT